MSLRSAFQKKIGSYDSDSLGYWSSSDVSSPLSDSQFILRPATRQNFYAKQPLYHTVEYDPYPASSSSYSSPSSCSLSASENEVAGDGDEGTLRPGSGLTIRSLKFATTSKIAACKTAFSSLAIRTRKNRPPLVNFTPPEEPQNTEDFLVFEEDASPKGRNDEVSIEELFNALKTHEEPPPKDNGISSVFSTIRRKQILIKEPDDSSKIYFDYRSKKRLPLPFKNCKCTPRSILKKEPSLSFTHLYEEIDGDHLSPLPDDARPTVPNRPEVRPMRLFPPCNDFQPRKMERSRVPLLRRRQKMPSFHQTEQEPATKSWSTLLRKKLFSKSSSDIRV